MLAVISKRTKPTQKVLNKTKKLETMSHTDETRSQNQSKSTENIYENCLPVVTPKTTSPLIPKKSDRNVLPVLILQQSQSDHNTSILTFSQKNHKKFKVC